MVINKAIVTMFSYECENINKNQPRACSRTGIVAKKSEGLVLFFIILRRVAPLFDGKRQKIAPISDFLQ